MTYAFDACFISSATNSCGGDAKSSFIATVANLG